MFVYNLLVRLYGFIIRVTSLRNQKAKSWISGRKNWKKNLALKLSNLNNSKRIWVHCASYGEFEQGRPLIEAIKKKHPDYSIILSFFSPSGYEAFHDWKGADVICYLPLDTPSNAVNFIEMVAPKSVLFIKYEFWVNYLFQLKKQGIPTFLVSAVFKEHHPFFKWYGALFRRSLETFTELFIQDENSATLLKKIGIANFEICGDTRFDRVLEIKNSFTSLPFIEKFCDKKKIIIGGSTWPKDDELLVESFLKMQDPEVKLILVPHNVNEKSIQNVQALLNKNKLSYSLYSKQICEIDKSVLIVDAMGLLSKLYHYAHVAYVGGGFNSGIHNCLEPSVYFIPLVFYGGDDFHKYNEAIDLLELGAAKNVKNTSDAISAFSNFLNNQDESIVIQTKLSTYFSKNSGTTNRVMEFMNWE